MRMTRDRIRNFRGLDDVDVAFDDVTTFIGPNGVGKSSILRTLDWFFNGPTLAEDDVFSGAEEKSIGVEVEFSDLTDGDRHKLGHRRSPTRGSFACLARRADRAGL